MTANPARRLRWTATPLRAAAFETTFLSQSVNCDHLSGEVHGMEISIRELKANPGKAIAQVRQAPSPSLSLGTTTPNGIDKLGSYFGVYGTTFV